MGALDGATPRCGQDRNTLEVQRGLRFSSLGRPSGSLHEGYFECCGHGGEGAAVVLFVQGRANGRPPLFPAE